MLVSAEAWSVEDGMVMLVAWWGEVGPLVGVHTSLPTNVITCAHTVVHFPPKQLISKNESILRLRVEFRLNVHGCMMQVVVESKN